MVQYGNVLSAAERIAVVSALVEGNSLRSVARMTGVARNTVAKLLVDLGRAAGDFQDAHLRGLHVKRMQTDEIWSYIGSKQRNVPQSKRGEYGTRGPGSRSTATRSSACPSWSARGTRAPATNSLQDVAERIVGRFQLSTDGLNLYPAAIEYALGGRVDYGQLVKQYGHEAERVGERRYSPAVCLGAERVIARAIPPLSTSPRPTSSART